MLYPISVCDFILTASSHQLHDQPVTRRFVDTSIINTKDRHVLVAALHHDVDYIITNDTRLRAEITAWLDHRPRRHKLIAAISPNQLTAELIGESPNEVVAVVTAIATRLRNPTRIATLAHDVLTTQPAWIIDHIRYLHDNHQLTSTDPVELATRIITTAAHHDLHGQLPAGWPAPTPPAVDLAQPSLEIG